MDTKTIYRKSQILDAFEEYAGVTSDDLDVVTVFQNGKEVVQFEHKEAFECLHIWLLKYPLRNGEKIEVEFHHDCPGCCVNAPTKRVVFNLQR